MTVWLSEFNQSPKNVHVDSDVEKLPSNYEPTWVFKLGVGREHGIMSQPVPSSLKKKGLWDGPPPPHLQVHISLKSEVYSSHKDTPYIYILVVKACRQFWVKANKPHFTLVLAKYQCVIIRSSLTIALHWVNSYRKWIFVQNFRCQVFLIALLICAVFSYLLYCHKEKNNIIVFKPHLHFTFILYFIHLIIFCICIHPWILCCTNKDCLSILFYLVQ